MKSVFVFASICMVASVQAQETDNVKEIRSTSKLKTVVPANIKYNKAKKFKRLLLGDHYRKEWAEPVEVEVLDLETQAGGLMPVRIGGGLQTKSLRLTGADGKEYVLRSVNKDPSKALPPEMVGTFAADVVQDQISSSHPYAPLAVAKLAEAAGIFHTTPKMVWVPASERLGEFSKEFANTLCLFEERPSGSDGDNAAYGFAHNIVNTEKLFQKLREDNDHLVNERAFLKARLFDMWIGDWDRHEDQWVWASFKKDGNTIYSPIPRDRDQAFARLDGFIPFLAARKWAIRKTKNFEGVIKDIEGLNINGVRLDKRFTVKLTLQDWLDVVHELQLAVTDDKIEEALEELPPNIFALSGKAIITALKQRRDKLDVYAREYYYSLIEKPVILGTDKKERFNIERKENGETKVTFFKINKQGQKSDLLYERIFSPNETKELLLYGLGGDDQFILSGKSDKGILIRLMGGSGNDSISDQSVVGGWSRKTKVYDSQIARGPGSESRFFISQDSAKNEYNPFSHKYDWLAPVISPGYNPDDGLYIGGGVQLKKQQFGKKPFGHSQLIWANYAFATGAYNFGYEGLFKEAVNKWDLNLKLLINAPNYVINYFGQGNETGLSTDDKNYNRVRSNQWNIGTSLSRQWARHHTLDMGVSYQSVKVEQNAGRFVSSPNSKLDSSDFEKNKFGVFQLNYGITTLDNPLYPRKGVKLLSGARFVQNLNDGSANFATFLTDFSFYFSVRALTFAFRSGIASNFSGDYEFYQGNTLGGSSNLRGFRRDRFTGKTSLYQNTEVRLKLNHINGYILRGSWGLLSFVDGGRVWIPTESSDKIHVGYGGGIWFLPYNRLAFTASYGVSEESQLLQIKAGFLF